MTLDTSPAFVRYFSPTSVHPSRTALVHGTEVTVHPCDETSVLRSTVASLVARALGNATTTTFPSAVAASIVPSSWETSSTARSSSRSTQATPADDAAIAFAK